MTEGKTETAATRSIGAQALKAFAHPLRMAMYDALRDHGSATATQLGERLGESSGVTSYHLRQLAKHGLVEDDPTHTGGRERWWRTVGFAMDDPTVLHDASLKTQTDTVLQHMLAERTQALGAVIRALPTDAWQTAIGFSSTTTTMTPAELDAALDEAFATIQRHADAAKAAHPNGPEGEARRVRIYLDGFPLP
ncbi:winged helix-turn-helix domain-containing protein [Cellulomonas citrea]|uniref:winged helix-turn-helix domain-containing protein n=1 Tax=Cellulomonas citrea TaxID=1909423 RepID=UPI00135902B2|nr:helix-turn-helix domain-containing protein [Cellulomonas citrea]